MDKPKVFVYGTLRKGHGNHHVIKEVMDKMIGKGYLYGTVNYSGLPRLKLDGLDMVKGEVYELKDEEGLIPLDQLEGHPYCYERKEVRVNMGVGGREKVFVYEYKGGMG